MYFSNKRKDPSFRRNNWIKYIVYFGIVNLLFVSIMVNSRFFHYLSIVIVIVAYYEIFKLSSSSQNIRSVLVVAFLFLLFATGFILFSLMPKTYLFYTLYLTTVFDAFSQLTGQLLGKRKLFPKISPNKTLEGLLGGLLFSMLTTVLIRSLLDISIWKSLVLGIGIASFAFMGDILASYCKRKFKIKDFSNLIPGHGGFLDRFDSFIFTGLFMFLINLLIKI